jgi:hypothetical protein
MKNRIIKIPKPNAFGNFDVYFKPKGTFVIGREKIGVSTPDKVVQQTLQLSEGEEE